MTETKTRIDQLRQEILERTRELVDLREQPKEFIPGETTVPYAGRVYDADEVVAGVDSMLDFWLTLGPYGNRFEKELANYLGIRKSLLVNSGSSANLLAISALTSYKLGERRSSPATRLSPSPQASRRRLRLLFKLAPYPYLLTLIQSPWAHGWTNCRKLMSKERPRL